MDRKKNNTPRKACKSSPSDGGPSSSGTAGGAVGGGGRKFCKVPTVDGHSTSANSTGENVCPNSGTKKRSFADRFSLGRLLYSSRFFQNTVRRQQQRMRATGAGTLDFTDIEKGAFSDNRESSSYHSEKFNRLSLDPKSAKSEESVYLFDCPLCLSEFPPECFPKLSTCNHRSCFDCLQQYLKLEISESRVNVACPECAEPLHPNDVKMVLIDDPVLFEKYLDFMLRRILAVDPDTRWCPAPDCGYAVIANGCASCPKLKCERPGCGSHFCYHCKASWHPNQTCDAARAERTNEHNPITFSHDPQTKEDIKRCPICRVLIVKMDDGSCNHMTCAVCGAEFCWLCMNVVGDLHYLSPSGCTFWGKKPWSRKKKILWQLGILVGAPVGIALIAGIAVPAILIGVPIWSGRKMYNRYQYSRKCRRNVMVVTGICAAIFMGPILASLAVAIGVPILLFYVYGVVPVSLCRSSGCGLSASANGVRLDFDESEYNTSTSAVNKSGSGSDDVDAAIHKEGNPSIGEASLSLGSGTNLEHLGREQDRESASTVGLAGSILAHKLEIMADVAQNNTTVYSETASERSDTATSSTRALHGSLLNYKTDALSTYSYKLSINEGCSTSGDQRSETNLSLSSLEELTVSLVQKVHSLNQPDILDDGAINSEGSSQTNDVQTGSTKSTSRAWRQDSRWKRFQKSDAV